jgi:hypothetical protein
VCEGSYSGNTVFFPASISDYGACGSGMVGPEVVYALDCSEPLLLLNLNFGAGSNQRLFLLARDGSNNCLGVAGVGGALVMPNLGPSRYFLVVDGTMSGTYFFSVHCVSAAPTATPTATPTLTPTPTRTGTPSATALLRHIYLPVTLKRSSFR